MLKLILRENMKSISRFLVFALILISADALATPVSTTVGSNLTAYNQGSGVVNNANWNTVMNSRSGAESAPVADFGNCNSLILRCAQPKCSSGGCTAMDVARPIVAGCVESNASCKQYGDDLIEYISAQIVASSTAKSNQQAADAQVAAAQAAAAQSAQQLQQMQNQMQQMQAQMQQQNAETTAQLQAALEEQKQLTAQAIAQANSAQQSASAATTSATATTTASSGALTQAQVAAASSGVSADVLARQQISGEILTEIENAEVSLKKLKTVLNTVYEYAGCDSSGNNCTGPKRVKTFKQKAMEFFDPYNAVLNDMYDALILAQSVGVDITDIYLMLNDSCNVWGQYLCGPGQVMTYNTINCVNGRSVPMTTAEGTVYGNAQCTVGGIVPMSDGGCQPIKALSSKDEIYANWLYPPEGSQEDVTIRIGCMSNTLDNSTLFRNLKRDTSIDIETLQRMIEQDAPTSFSSTAFGTSTQINPVKYCAVNATTYQDLQKSVSLKTLPSSVCVPDSRLEALVNSDGLLVSDSTAEDSVQLTCGALSNANYEYDKCVCNNGVDKNYMRWDDEKKTCVCSGGVYKVFDIDRGACLDSTGKSRADKKLEEAYDKEKEKRLATFDSECQAAGGKVEKSAIKVECSCTAIKDISKMSECLLKAPYAIRL